MGYGKDAYSEVARHIAPWFWQDAARHTSIKNKDVVIRLLMNVINNIIYNGSYHVSSGPYKMITVREWVEAVERLGFQEALNQKYWVLRRNYVPNKHEDPLCEVASIMFETIAEVCSRRHWGLELNDHNGNKGGSFGEWIDLNKAVFKRTFWKLWKRYKREE